ncbi:MAG: hypothetical protein GY868_21290, partial [Deltaproteobacteria bacterium]|nr:hypothetical protein [Deltaproteobacteria bacterium]
MRAFNLPDTGNLKTILGPTIYDRALLYNRNGNVKEFRTTSGFIFATVKGSGLHSYGVEIHFDTTGKIRETFCTCPYHRGVCKHVGAVLLHARTADSSRDIDETLRKANEAKETLPDKIIPAPSQHTPAQPHNFLQDIQQSLSFSAAPQVTGRFKLIFLIQQNPDRYYGHSAESNWTLGPAAQYIKKDGSPGRIEPFQHKKITEPVSDHENELLLLFQSANFKPVDFTIHINSFIEAGPPDELYFQNSDACIPLKTAQAESTRIEFHLCSITDNETLFAPLAIIRHPAGETIIDRSNNQILARAGHTFYCIDPRGTLLHKKRSALYARFMTELFTTREPFTAGQISALSDFAEEHLKDHISISFTPRPVRIMHARPQPFVELETQKQTLLCKLRFDYQGHICSS